MPRKTPRIHYNITAGDGSRVILVLHVEGGRDDVPAMYAASHRAAARTIELLAEARIAADVEVSGGIVSVIPDDPEIVAETPAAARVRDACARMVEERGKIYGDHTARRYEFEDLAERIRRAAPLTPPRGPVVTAAVVSALTEAAEAAGAKKDREGS